MTIGRREEKTSGESGDPKEKRRKERITRK